MYDSSIYFLKKAEEILHYPLSFQLATTIYKYLADNYAATGDYRNAWTAGNKVIISYDSLIKRRKTFEALKLISDDELSQSKSELKTYEIQQSILIGIILIVLLSLILILFFYSRLNKSHKLLIKKNIDLVRSEMSSLGAKSKKDKHPIESKMASDVFDSQHISLQPSDHSHEHFDPVMMRELATHT